MDANARLPTEPTELADYLARASPDPYGHAVALADAAEEAHDPLWRSIAAAAGRILKARGYAPAKVPFDGELRQQINALARCSILPGTWDKRFVRDLAALPAGSQISPRQAQMIARLLHRYRRQLRPNRWGLGGGAGGGQSPGAAT
jgi:hypothetical protein